MVPARTSAWRSTKSPHPFHTRPQPMRAQHPMRTKWRRITSDTSHPVHADLASQDSPQLHAPIEALAPGERKAQVHHNTKHDINRGRGMCCHRSALQSVVSALLSWERRGDCAHAKDDVRAMRSELLVRVTPFSATVARGRTFMPCRLGSVNNGERTRKRVIPASPSPITPSHLPSLN